MLSPLLVALYVFLLAIFVGRELLTKVPHTLHTPLMSGANAISASGRSWLPSSAWPP